MMNSQQKFEEDVVNDKKSYKTAMTYPFSGILADYYMYKESIEKPAQYQIGIDTFARMEANCSKEEILAFCKGNIDKYTWRTKGCDLEDFKKIIDYANFAIKQLEKNGEY